MFLKGFICGWFGLAAIAMILVWGMTPRISGIEYGAGSLAALPYEAVRTAADPHAALLEFLESAYQAGAAAAGWDTAALASSWCPLPA